MAVPASVLRTHIDFTSWASARLVEAASKLTPEELTRDFGTANKSVLETLFHVYAADRIWLARVEDVKRPFIEEGEPVTLEVLQTQWPALLDRWKSWAASLTEEQAAGGLDHTDLQGRHWNTPVWQVVLHVVNHATHHRGQAMGFLRAMGHTPPPLDLIRYYRELAKQ
ncbi:MAG: DinB family protein [Bryobacterales bacterium]|nr:DinB family protein [Bryobacterales bacterium]